MNLPDSRRQKSSMFVPYKTKFYENVFETMNWYSIYKKEGKQKESYAMLWDAILYCKFDPQEKRRIDIPREMFLEFQRYYRENVRYDGTNTLSYYQLTRVSKQKIEDYDRVDGREVRVYINGFYDLKHKRYVKSVDNATYSMMLNDTLSKLEPAAIQVEQLIASKLDGKVSRSALIQIKSALSDDFDDNGGYDNAE